MSSSTEDIIKKIYYDPATGLTGAKKLLKRVKEVNPKITMKEVKQFMNNQSIVQSTKKYDSQGSFIPQDKHHQLQIDIFYFAKWKNPKLNSGNKYGFVAINTFSKKAHVVVMKEKNQQESVKAMKECIQVLGKPKQIYCDRGGEFNGNEFKEYASSEKIEIIFTHHHASVAERFIRTIKELIFKHLESTGTQTIIHILPSILKNYNTSDHRTIGTTPEEAHKEKNENEVHANIAKHATTVVRPEIKPGDRVRVYEKPETFTKGSYSHHWGEVAVVESETTHGRYNIMHHTHPYLRAHLQKVGGKVEINPTNKDELLKGTLEGRLRQKGGLKAQQKKFYKEAEKSQQEEIKEPEQMVRRSNRRTESATKALIHKMKGQGYG